MVSRKASSALCDRAAAARCFAFATACGLWALVGTAPALAQAALGSVTLTMGGDGLQFLTQHLAVAGGFFKQEGLDATTLDVGSGPRQVAALMGGSSELSSLGFIHVIKANAAGAKLVAVSTELDVMDIQLVLSNAAIAKAGIKDGMSIDQKVEKLSGLKLAITSPGSTTDTYLRNMLLARKHDPDTMLSIQPTGGGSNMLAAFEKGATDGFAWGAPQAQMAVQEGAGKIIVNPFKGDLPEMAGVPYLVIVTSRDTLQNKPQVVRAGVRAMARAMRFAQDHPDEAKGLIRKHFPEVSDPIFDAAWADYRTGIPKTPVLTRDQFVKTFQWLKLAGPIKDVKFEDVVDSSMAQQASAEILGK